MAIKTILVPTDFSLNGQVAFERALELARLLKAELHVMHVQDESNLRTAVREGLLTESSTDEELEEQVKQLIDERISQMLSGFDLLDMTVHRVSRRGDPKSVIIEVASEIAADLVVVGMSGTTAREKLRSVVIGSVAESVMRKSPCPTLVVRVDHKK